MKESKVQKLQRRHKRVRAKIKGTLNRPRLSVFRSNKHVWLQLIDDVSGRTLAAASDQEVLPNKIRAAKGAKNRKEKISFFAAAEEAGKILAKKALEQKKDKVVFDRGGYKYHGIVKAAADGARKGGLEF